MFSTLATEPAPQVIPTADVNQLWDAAQAQLTDSLPTVLLFCGGFIGLLVVVRLVAVVVHGAMSSNEDGGDEISAYERAAIAQHNEDYDRDED